MNSAAVCCLIYRMLRFLHVWSSSHSALFKVSFYNRFHHVLIFETKATPQRNHFVWGNKKFRFIFWRFLWFRLLAAKASLPGLQQPPRRSTWVSFLFCFLWWAFSSAGSFCSAWSNYSSPQQSLHVLSSSAGAWLICLCIVLLCLHAGQHNTSPVFNSYHTLVVYNV